MAKRFTDNEKWKKPFFKKLSTINKLFFLYIIDECDHAGIWNVEEDIAQIRIGEEVNIRSAQKEFGKHVHVFDNGEKWFIPTFLEFQYGTLNPNVNAHKSVIDKLAKKKLTKIYEQFINCSLGVKAKDTDMDKDIITKEQFDKLWIAYPGKAEQKGSKEYAYKCITTKAKHKFTYEQTLVAFKSYASGSEQVAKGIVYNVSTFINKGFTAQWLGEFAEDTGTKKKEFELVCPNKCKNEPSDIVSDKNFHRQCDNCGEKKVLKK